MPLKQNARNIRSPRPYAQGSRQLGVPVASSNMFAASAYGFPSYPNTYTNYVGIQAQAFYGSKKSFSNSYMSRQAPSYGSTNDNTN